MREIKFRAWFISSISGQVCSMQEDRTLLEFLQSCEDIKKDHGYKYVLMQFTELKDKNGKEIYEGDILIPGLREVMCGIFISLAPNGEPYSQGNGFYTISRDGKFPPMPFSFCHRQSDDCEIIGNIYENPDKLTFI